MFFAEIFGENILKIKTSVSGHAELIVVQSFAQVSNLQK
jgi:hypothetical protein